MEKSISIGILKGCPFGGVGILLKNNNNLNVKAFKEFERSTLIVLQKTIIISMYLPTVTNATDLDLLDEILHQIESFIVDFPHHNIICGGDLNVCLNANSREATRIRDFITKFNLAICDNSLSVNKDGGLNFTFSNETLGRFSYIDYILISKSQISNAIDFKIIDSAINMSDHNPVALWMKQDVIKQPSTKLITKDIRQEVLRWDHSDLRSYYIISRVSYLSLCTTSCSVLTLMIVEV